MKGRYLVVALLAAVAMTAAGCDSAREMLGQGKRAPDEFLVYSRKPLNVPPNYDLRPPSGEAARGLANEPVSDARSALVGGGSAAAGGSVSARSYPTAAADTPGMAALLQRTGAMEADPDIRAQINRETTILAEKDQSLTERLLFWKTPTEYGTVVDPEEESRRIRENQALGKAVTEGRTPTIAREKRGMLEGIF